MKTFSTLLNQTTKLAFDGSTYFIKYLQSANGWLPVQSINFNPINGVFKVVGVYGANTGSLQYICDHKGRKVVNITGFTFKAEDLQIDNRIKLYNSRVITEINTVYPQEMLKEAYKFNEDLTMYMNCLKLLNTQTIWDTIPIQFKKYLQEHKPSI